MVNLQTVKHIEIEDIHTVEGPGKMLRTSILMYLVLPWAQSGRSFCTNFDFTLVTTAQVMIGNGFCFIYVLETATKNAYEISSFPREIDGRGQREVVVMKTRGRPSTMAYIWVDRNSWYCISTSFSLKDTKSYSY